VNIELGLKDYRTFATKHNLPSIEMMRGIFSLNIQLIWNGYSYEVRAGHSGLESRRYQYLQGVLHWRGFGTNLSPMFSAEAKKVGAVPPLSHMPSERSAELVKQTNRKSH
jgi:hypothetical protein